MCLVTSAEAPEFFLHHAFIDKIWSDWQETRPCEQGKLGCLDGTGSLESSVVILRVSD